MNADDSTKEIADGVLRGDMRALARAISLVEAGGSRGSEILRSVFPNSGRAHIIGVTGSPGAGKSTLVDQLIRHFSANQKKIAVLAVDPTSPFTGGALLGDRIRMLRAAELPGVYVRSMASRGALGGLAPKTAEAAILIDAAGFDYIIVETVGVGQGEIEIVRHADTVALVLVPGMGDGVQALKAGIIEIADVFVINKADFPGADALQKELIAVMGLAGKAERQAKIVQTVAAEGKGIAELAAEIEKHRQWAESSGAGAKRKETFLMQTFERELAQAALAQALAAASGMLDQVRASLRLRTTDPVTLAQEVLRNISVPAKKPTKPQK